MNKWTSRYLDMARHIGEWSKDPSTKIGAIVIGQEGQVLSQGYNGFPRGVKDLASRLKNREEKYEFTVHAEMNCIYNSSLNGISLKGGHMYVDGLPVCHKCAPGIIQVGINKIVARFDPDRKHGDWIKSGKLAHQMFKEAGINYMAVDLNGNMLNEW